MEPRAPRLLSWAVVGRVFGRGVAALTLVALLALVAWPERSSECMACQLRESARRRLIEARRSSGDLTRFTQKRLRRAKIKWRRNRTMACRRPDTCPRDSSLAVLLGR